MLPLCLEWHFSPVIPPLLAALGWVRGSRAGAGPGCRETGGGNLFFPFPACKPCAHLPASLPPSCPVFPAVSTLTKRLLCRRLRKHVSNHLIRASGQHALGWVFGESRASRTHPPSLGEPRDAPDPALGSTSMTLRRARSRFFIQTPPATVRICIHNSFERRKSHESNRLVCFVEVGFLPPVSQEPPR